MDHVRLTFPLGLKALCSEPQVFDTRSEQKRDKWIEFDRKRPETVPSWFKTVNEWPDVLIAPEECVRSPLYTGVSFLTLSRRAARS